ncbi:MAG: family 78 glycoside hydrolase catalytic domain, partial [Acidobacteria bacterium]|nr:family 78 glycoside hydrolase catalytic domain [Acidobacteriota bacterium]
MLRAGFLLAVCACVACAQPVHLRTEYRVNPIGMDEPRPRLTWMLQGSMMQSAYQVRVASEARPGLFDSGKIVSSANSTVYDGPALRSRDRVSWQVRVWDERDVPTEWSEPASFEMGLLAREDWTARWIAHPVWQHGDPMPVFRRRFAVAKAVDRARLYITGLGMYSAAMNGREVTPDVLTPGNTLYTQRVEYGAYDVTPLLITGENSLVVELGNGIFNSVKTADRYFGLTFPSAAPVRMIAQLEIAFTDGTSQIQASGSEWETALGATTVSTWFGGEDYDARREIAVWGHAAVAETPAGDPKLAWRAGPGVRTYATALPVGVTEPRPGVHVFDMGVNLAGWPQIHVSGTRGTTVRMKIGELLGSDGLVREDTVGGNIYDSYTLSGNGLESWHPKFAYHGFR